MTDLVERARMRAKMIHDGDYRDPVDGYLTSTMLIDLAAEIERLRSQLYHATVAVDGIRDHALEEAAQVADPIGGDTGETDYEKQAYDLRWNVAAAIRALKT
jgi:hypothetical protein